MQADLTKFMTDSQDFWPADNGTSGRQAAATQTGLIPTALVMCLDHLQSFAGPFVCMIRMSCQCVGVMHVCISVHKAPLSRLAMVFCVGA